MQITFDRYIFVTTCLSCIKIALVMYEIVLIVYMNWNGESESEDSDAEDVKI